LTLPASKIALENAGFQELFWDQTLYFRSSELAVLPIAPLTTEEEGDRLHLERKVERAFYEAGMALMQLRDRRLYRTTHTTFEEYCRDRFDYIRRRPYQLIEAALIYDNLIKKCVKFLHILPTNIGHKLSL
jgi:hypothetical protein